MSRHLQDSHEPPVYDAEALWRTVDVLVGIADARGVPAAPVALAWLLARPGITSLVVGARTEEQLAQNLTAATLELAPAEHDALERVSRQPLPYPYWHQRAEAADRLGPAERSLLDPYLAEAE